MRIQINGTWTFSKVRLVFSQKLDQHITFSNSTNIVTTNLCDLCIDETICTQQVYFYHEAKSLLQIYSYYNTYWNQDKFVLGKFSSMDWLTWNIVILHGDQIIWSDYIKSYMWDIWL